MSVESDSSRRERQSGLWGQGWGRKRGDRIKDCLMKVGKQQNALNCFSFVNVLNASFETTAVILKAEQLLSA